MALWYVSLSCLAVWAVFRDPRLDFRFVAAGSMLPLLIDAVRGEWWFGHTLLAAVAALLLAVAVTAGRKPLRPRLVMLPVGMLMHLVLDGTFSSPEHFWWPVQGAEFDHHSLLPSVGVIVFRELVGLVAGLWFVRRFDLFDAERRRRFLSTGRVEAAT